MFLLKTLMLWYQIAKGMCVNKLLLSFSHYIRFLTALKRLEKSFLFPSFFPSIYVEKGGYL